MSAVCGVYGFQVTKPIKLTGLQIKPRASDYAQVRSWASDLHAYNLTAVIVGDSIDNGYLFDLECVLSFLERLDVVVTLPTAAAEADLFTLFPLTIRTRRRQNGGGPVIGEDTFFPTSRGDFIAKAMEKLGDKVFCEASHFRELIFKFVQTFRQPEPYVDITWFLLYSGLEAFARGKSSGAKGKSLELICQLLKRYGFNVEENKHADLRRNMSTYKDLRDRLFHNSEYEVQTRAHTVKVKMTDYLFNLEQLVALTILRAVEFDDGHINWDSWIDRQPFK